MAGVGLGSDAGGYVPRFIPVKTPARPELQRFQGTALGKHVTLPVVLEVRFKLHEKTMGHVVLPTTCCVTRA